MGVVSHAVLQSGGSVTGVVPYAMVAAGGEVDQAKGLRGPHVALKEEGRENVRSGVLCACMADLTSTRALQVETVSPALRSAGDAAWG